MSRDYLISRRRNFSECLAGNPFDCVGRERHRHVVYIDRERKPLAVDRPGEVAVEELLRRDVAEMLERAHGGQTNPISGLR